MIPFIAKAKKNPITKEVKYYAQVAPVDHVELLSITSSISEKCTVTEHDVKAVLSALQMSIAKHITDGNSVRFGDLGSFRLTIKGTPADTKEKAGVANIERLRVAYTQSGRLSQIFNSDVSGLKFEKVSDKA
ncbi:MAG: HU family DNA-binding protein [Prevotellamassilia sp.]|jgi:predicted histone-like DNA-binding protein|uniref:HU family DNA-binding protein n=1 Tax=Alloprevotella sp. TaxID=1872471 RepID=UPI002EC575D8|nr:HU family DNA-binding protein [Prevotellamassilia sp.]